MSGPNETTIMNTLNWRKNNIDPNCANWLSRISSAIDVLMSGNNGPVIGYGTFGVVQVRKDHLRLPSPAAFTGGNASPTQASPQPTTNAPVGYGMVVNAVGPFFAGNFTNSQGQTSALSAGGYAGNTGSVRAFILLHELAHLLSARGFQPDLGKPKVGQQNDKLVHDNCKGTLKAAKNAP